MNFKVLYDFFKYAVIRGDCDQLKLNTLEDNCSHIEFKSLDSLFIGNFKLNKNILENNVRTTCILQDVDTLSKTINNMFNDVQLKIKNSILEVTDGVILVRHMLANESTWKRVPKPKDSFIAKTPIIFNIDKKFISSISKIISAQKNFKAVQFTIEDKYVKINVCNPVDVYNGTEVKCKIVNMDELETFPSIYDGVMFDSSTFSKLVKNCDGGLCALHSNKYMEFLVNKEYKDNSIISGAYGLVSNS
jgi:hypothetical protein